MKKGGGRENAYVKSNDPSASRDERMTRLKFELREHIRFLADYPILSTDWLRMAESLHQIANVAFMETHLPPSDQNPLLQQGKKTSGTLWDQEKDELAVRILLEEGKLNLALRILHYYKNLERETSRFESELAICCKKFNSDKSTVNERCRVFEQSLGILLKYAFGHVEALQIMDVPEFMQHISEVLEDAKDSKKTELMENTDKMQDTLVISYLASVAVKMIDDMDEDRVMDLVERNRIFPLLAEHMRRHYTWYRLETLQASALFFSNAMRSDAFTTEEDRFVKDEEAMRVLVDLKGLYFQQLIDKHDFKKSEIHTLMAKLEKYEAIVGKAKHVPLVVVPEPAK